MAKRFFGLNPDKRKDELGNIALPLGLEREGVTAPGGIKDNFFNQVMFQAAGVDHVLGSSSQLALNACTMKWNGTALVDKNDAPVTLVNYDRIDIIGSDAWTGNLDLSALEGLTLNCVNGYTLDTGAHTLTLGSMFDGKIFIADKEKVVLGEKSNISINRYISVIDGFLVMESI